MIKWKIMRLSCKAIWGIVVILDLESKISSVEKYQETFGRETIKGILFTICLMEPSVELDGILMSIYNSYKERN